MNNRRKLIVAIGAAAFVSPLSSFAQPATKVWRIGILTPFSNDGADAGLFESFRQGMRKLGYEPGRNIAYEERWAEGKLERMPGFAAELAGLKPDVIFVAGTPGVLALKKATTTIPIVMTNVGDPVGNGLVASLARPGGNVTGNTSIVGEMTGKRLQLLKQAVPRLSRVAVLGHPGDPIFAVQLRHAQTVARSLKIEVFPVEIRAVSELDRAFETIVKRRADGILRMGDPLIGPGRLRTSELALQHRLPTMVTRLDEVEAGLLMSYGPDRFELFRQAATYVDKILKGTKPADLPVEQPIKFEMVINMKTAKALGIKIPDVIMLRADKVIE